MFTGKKGYIGNKYSVRAEEAYQDGRVPISHIKKLDIELLDLKYKMTVKLFKYFAEKIGSSEWHHTGKYFNKTDFYNLEEIAAEINQLSEEEYNKYKSSYEETLIKEKLEIEEKKSITEYRWVKISWKEWIDKRKTVNYSEYGIMVNGWIHIYHYGKKKANGNYVSYTVVTDKECKLRNEIKELLLDQLGICKLTDRKRKNRIIKASDYKVITIEEARAIEKAELLEKKALERIEIDKQDTSVKKRNNILKKIIELEEKYSFKIIKDKNIDRWHNLYEAKKELDKFTTTILHIYSIKWEEVLLKRQQEAEKLGFDYYIENLKINAKQQLDTKKCKELYLKRMKEVNIANEQFK